MIVTETGERASPRAAYSPPNPPPTITTRGRLSGIAVVDERMAHLSRKYDRLAPLVLMARVLDARRRPQRMEDGCIALTHTELSLLRCAREGGEAAPIPDASSCAEACPVIESVEELFGSGHLDAKQQRVRHRNKHLREARIASGMSPSPGTSNGPTLPPPAAPVQPQRQWRGTALGLAGGHTGGRGRHAGSPARAQGAAGPAGAGAAGGAACTGRVNFLSAGGTAPEAQLCSCLSRALSRLRPQFPNGIVSSVSFVSTTNTARSLAGCVSLALGARSHLAGQQVHREGYQ